MNNTELITSIFIWMLYLLLNYVFIKQNKNSKINKKQIHKNNI